MSQVLDDFLGVLCLACSRLTPAKRVEGVLGKMRLVLSLHPLQHVLLSTILPFCEYP